VRVIVLVAVVARLAVGLALLSQGPEAFVLASDDGDAYDGLARWLAFGTPIDWTERLIEKSAHEPTLTARWPQGYWLFLAAQYRLFGSAYMSTIVQQSLLGACGVLVGYALARHVLSRQGAIWAALGVALCSTSIVLSATLSAEALYVPLLAMGLAGATRIEDRRWLFASGVAFALAEATRPLALPVFLVAMAWCWWRGSLATALPFALGFALAIAPFLLRDLVAEGRVTTFTAGGADALAHSIAQDASILERLAVMLAIGGWAPLGEPLVSALGGAAPWLRLGEIGLAAIGIFRLVSIAQTRPVAWLILAAIAALLVPPLLIGLPLVRYRAAADPLLILAMAGGAATSWSVARGWVSGLQTRPKSATAWR
jgi:hypothetical protein